MGDRLVLLATSPRVAPGLLTDEAWALLRSADLVLLPDDDHPLLAPLRAADVGPSLVPAYPVAALAAALLDAARGRTAVWVASADGDPGLADALVAATEYDGAPTVEVVLGSWDLPGAHLLDLVAVMDRLRSPGGCPWDAEQTHESIVEYLVEEAYETVEAIETGDDAALREELGDLLLQVAFHARIAQEHDQPWGIDDVADGIAEKLVRRHPHVFADHDASTPDEVEASWKRLKAQEKGRASVTDGIPVSLPALVLAGKLLRRAADVDAAPVHPGAAAAARLAVAAFGTPPGSAPGAAADREAAYGELLLALATQAHEDGVDAEQALRASLRAYRARIRAAEHLQD
ncbi:MAG TPA: MazG family protein [Candidatus Nanopelagicales bacterium]|nr:MazG family protein [Candidatus Nanopelagicales bacterium]